MARGQGEASQLGSMNGPKGFAVLDSGEIVQPLIFRALRQVDGEPTRQSKGLVGAFAGQE